MTSSSWPDWVFWLALAALGLNLLLVLSYVRLARLHV